MTTLFSVAVVWANTVECVTGQFLLNGVHNTEPGSSEGVSPSGWITWGVHCTMLARSSHLVQ